MDLKSLVRTIPDYPKEGIMFRDITTLLAHGDGLRVAVEQLAAPYRDMNVSTVVGLEARGFIVGAPVAERLGVGFVPLRKRGKLPGATISQDYSLEYGMDVIEMHDDVISAGQRVLIVDDLIATGGTAEAAVKLLNRVGAEIVGAAFVIDLPDLGGVQKLNGLGIDCHRLIEFEGD